VIPSGKLSIDIEIYLAFLGAQRYSFPARMKKTCDLPRQTFFENAPHLSYFPGSEIIFFPGLEC
jgi:hypothetical protein